MSDSQDWRGSLTASERYDNIQKMSVSLMPFAKTHGSQGLCH